MINSIGNLGGQAGPYIIGFISNKFHNMTIAMVALAAFCWISSIVTVVFFRHRPVKQ
jgi:nitrate/nitrite transporter NarK